MHDITEVPRCLISRLLRSRTQPSAAATGFRYGWGSSRWLAENCEGATPSSRRNMSLKLLGE
jgi:hypothetical protein